MKFMSKDFFNFIKFAIVGVMNTLLNWIIFFFLNNVGVYYIVSNIIAYTISTIHSYFWNSIWVFKYSEGSKAKASLKFILLNIGGLILNTSILFILVDVFKMDKFIGLILTTAIVMIINYIFNKVWVFKK
ncbi:GtrA family protein [Clostridium sp.]|uniref:GtrA family protein n=1 Tax=Clostridium sp. TaxID=1506 RepID=UPI003F3121F7